MLALFCVRLAFGLFAGLLLLADDPINPRFYRAHFLTALALLVGGLVLLSGSAEAAALAALGAAATVALLGSMSWMLDQAPAGKLFVALAAALSGAALALVSWQRSPQPAWALADDFTSAAFLGAATTAMLLGHSYLIAPTMSIRPLQKLLVALAAAWGLRVLLALGGLWLWTGAAARDNLETEVFLWLAARWVVGLLIPMALAWMTWETARIRSTQSATGILYVVVICCFLGELTSLLLSVQTASLL